MSALRAACFPCLPALQARIQQQQWRQLYVDLCQALEAAGGEGLAWEEEYLWAMQAICSRVFIVRYPGGWVCVQEGVECMAA